MTPEYAVSHHPNPNPSPQHPHHLRNVAVRIGVGRPAPDDDQHRLVEGNGAAGRIKGGADPVARGAKELLVDAELARVSDLHLRVFRLEGVEHGRDVVLGVARREQHPGHREAEPVATRAKLLETLADDGGRELEKPALDVVLREPLPNARRHPIRTR